MISLSIFKGLIPGSASVCSGTSWEIPSLGPPLSPWSRFRGSRIPEDAVAAMDFHLDWLYASLHVAFAGGIGTVIPNRGESIAGQQKDIDYLSPLRKTGTTR